MVNRYCIWNEVAPWFWAILLQTLGDLHRKDYMILKIYLIWNGMGYGIRPQCVGYFGP